MKYLILGLILLMVGCANIEEKYIVQKQSEYYIIKKNVDGQWKQLPPKWKKKEKANIMKNLLIRCSSDIDNMRFYDEIE